MANNKVQLANGQVLIDLTEDTVTPEVLGSGYTAHDASGQQITGTMTALTVDALSVSSNGVYTPSSNHAFGQVTVNVSGDDDHYLADLLARSVSSSYYNPVLTNAGPYAFTGCSSMVTADLPACTYVGDRAFMSCDKLVSVNLPVCSYIGTSAFSNCRKLKRSCRSQFRRNCQSIL